MMCCVHTKLMLATMAVLTLVMGQLQAQNASSGNAVTSDVTQGALQIVKGGKVLELPLKHTDVDARVSGYIARVTVTQQFTNPYRRPIEAIYVFPLPANSAVDGMTMIIGNRIIKAEIKERAQARETYEQAKAEGKTASLLEQERPNIFTQSVANIMPGQDIYIQITYVQDLLYDHGTYEFSFPMVVGPRYIPGNSLSGTSVVTSGSSPTSSSTSSKHGWSPNTDQVPDASRITPPVIKPGYRSGNDISLRLYVDAGVPITAFDSPSHDIYEQRVSEHQVFVAIKSGDQIPNKDFIFRYQVSGEKPAYALLTHAEGGKGYFMLMIQPQAHFRISDITPREMFFIIDRSGSMSGFPIEKVKEAMRLAIENMHPSDYFQIISFSNSAEHFAERPLPNTPENVRKALKYVDELNGSGGTEMLTGINEAFDSPRNPMRRRFIFFMSDGFVGNESSILDVIEQKLGDARVFTFGVGSSPNRYLIDKMAEFGHGYATYCRQDENPLEKVRLFYNRISMPLIMDIAVDWGGLAVEEPYPGVVPDLFAGQPVIIHGRYTSPGEATIKITGKVAGKEITQEIPVVFPADEPQNDVIAALWARTKIEHLMNLMVSRENPETVRQVTDIALEYKLMSAYTSFVAVEERVSNPEKVLESITVPVPLPEGVSYEGVFGPQGEVHISGEQGFTPPEEAPPEMPAPAPGNVTGEVLDATGEALAYAVISLAKYGQETGIAAAAGSDGRYVITNIPAGIYDVEISMRGHSTVILKDIQVESNKTVVLENVKMEQGRGGVWGRIVDRDNSKPLPGVTAVLSQKDTQTSFAATTGMDGRFGIQDMPCGVYSLELSKKDYKNLAIGDVEITSAGSFSLGDVGMEKEPGMIVGRVLDSRARPLADAHIAVYENGAQVAAGIMTDANGRYEIPNLEAGIYTIEASNDERETATIREIRVTAGGISTAKDARLKTVEVEEQSATRTPASNLTYTNGGGGSWGNVTGRVLDAYDGSPLSDCNVILWQNGRQTEMGAAADRFGRYMIRTVPRGSYDVEFSFVGYSTLVMQGVQVSAGKVVTLPDVKLQAGGIQVSPCIVEADRVAFSPAPSHASIGSTMTNQVEARASVSSMTETIRNYQGSVWSTDELSGGLHMQGGRSNELVYLVDGINANDPVAGRSGVFTGGKAGKKPVIITYADCVGFSLTMDTVRYEPFMTLGMLDYRAVVEAFERLRPKLKLTYLEYLAENQSLCGRVAVSISVSADGTVKEVFMKHSTLRDAELEQTLVKELENLRFTPSTDESLISVAWVFEIK